MSELNRYWKRVIENLETNQLFKKKEELMADQRKSIVRVTGQGFVYERIRFDDEELIRYKLHLSLLIKEKKEFYIEEMVIPMELSKRKSKIVSHTAMHREKGSKHLPESYSYERQNEGESSFYYDRAAAVRYAELWWNDYNPNYPHFPVDCTNYISQCLRAGGAPMRGAPNRNRGWWYRDKNNGWSFSWSVAHSMRWYLSGSLVGLKGTEVQTPQELRLGDVICYDFEGDGRWDHTTIVTAKDENNMPLVNAHTNNSRHRYWSYQDSLAWTEKCRYKFFRIS